MSPNGSAHLLVAAWPIASRACVREWPATERPGRAWVASGRPGMEAVAATAQSRFALVLHLDERLDRRARIPRFPGDVTRISATTHPRSRTRCALVLSDQSPTWLDWNVLIDCDRHGVRLDAVNGDHGGQ
jgi:hypothetical protein